MDAVTMIYHFVVASDYSEKRIPLFCPMLLSIGPKAEPLKRARP